LGLASCAFAQKDNAGAKNVLHKAMPAGQDLFNQHLIQTRIDTINSLSECETARAAIGGELDRSNKTVHDFYQVGLHLGLALGNAHADEQDWRTLAGQLFVRGILQALQDINSPIVNPVLSKYGHELAAMQELIRGPEGPARAALQEIIDRMADEVGRSQSI